MSTAGKIILMFICPPLSVVEYGCGAVFVVSLWTMLGWIPGIIVASTFLSDPIESNRYGHNKIVIERNPTKNVKQEIHLSDKTTKESVEPNEKSIGYEDSKVEDMTTEIQPIIEKPEINYGVEMERFTLKEFSLLYGKMQVKTVKLEDGELQSYCTFTNNGIETKVYFDDKLGTLSATEISARKSSLCVIEYEEKQYVLSNAL